MPSALEEAKARLYAEPPDTFTAARDEAVRVLKAAGDREGAAALKAERRPTPMLWALRTAAAHERAEVRDVIDAASAVALAQAQSSDGLRDALRDLRDAVQAAAGSIADRSGVDREVLRGALLNLVASQELLNALERGTLDAVPDASGFGGEITLSSPPRRTKNERAKAAPVPSKPKVDRMAERRLEVARKQVIVLQRKVDDAREALAKIEAELVEADAVVRDAERALGETR